MVLFRQLMIVFVMFSMMGQANAAKREQNFFRTIWNPTYLGQRLNYCTLDEKECGLPVATRYCKMLGYERASEGIIDYNVGLTNILLSRAQCRGWSCNGFMLITCVAHFSHQPAENYYYRSQRFVFPRFDHYRIDWCYEEGKGCGYRAAHSFCRRMGYLHAKYFKKEEHLGATKALGNHQLCFGRECSGFSEISCYR